MLMNRTDLSASTFNPSLLAISNQAGRLVGIEPQNQKTCVDCCTTRTPLWRAGPAGPRSLCNACGIRYRKMIKNNMNNMNNGGAVTINRSGKGKKVGGAGSLKVRMVGLGREIVLHRAGTMTDNGVVVAEAIGEEEQAAAMLLMALSSGYV